MLLVQSVQQRGLCFGERAGLNLRGVLLQQQQHGHPKRVVVLSTTAVADDSSSGSI